LIALAAPAAGVVENAIDSRLPLAQQTTLAQRAGGLTLKQQRGQASLIDLPPNPLQTCLDRLNALADRIDTNAPSLILWTSGTTREPRGVVLSQTNLTLNAAAKLTAVPQSTDDRRLTVLSLAHAYARTCDLGTWLLSGCQLQLGLGRRAFDQITPESAPTLINCVPSLATQILHEQEQAHPAFSKLRLLGCGGAALNADTFDRFSRLGVEVIQGYGLTESSPVICSASPGHGIAGCVGTLVDGWQHRICDQRLFVRGEGVMLGYLHAPNATRTKIDDDGWLDTGDLVQQHTTGQFQILGRADDVIVLPNGFQVHPLVIERAIVGLDDVEYAVLMWVEQRLILAVQSETRSDDDVIRRVLQDQLPPTTRCEILHLSPPLSIESGELTNKSTPRRHVVRKRFES